MNDNNLRPALSKSEAQKRGAAGGRASGKARRERRAIALVYAEYLARKHDITWNGKKKILHGEDFVFWVCDRIMERCDASTVRLLSEIRQTIEGSRLNIEMENPLKIQVHFEEEKEKLKARLNRIAEDRAS